MQINFKEALNISGYTEDSSSKAKSSKMYDQLYESGISESDPEIEVSPQYYLEDMHKETKNAGILNCTKCTNICLTENEYKGHMMTHRDKYFECTLCSKRFSLSYRLRRHQRTHNGDKPYGCSHCGKMFSDTSDLKKHQRTHTGEKPYECTTCGKMFRTVSNRKKHILIHTGERPYSCAQCRKSYSQSNNLKTHLRTHK